MKVAEARALCGGDAPRWVLIATCRQHQPVDELHRKMRRAARHNNHSAATWTQEARDFMARTAHDIHAKGRQTPTAA